MGVLIGEVMNSMNSILIYCLCGTGALLLILLAVFGTNKIYQMVQDKKNGYKDKYIKSDEEKLFGD